MLELVHTYHGQPLREHSSQNSQSSGDHGPALGWSEGGITVHRLYSGERNSDLLILLQLLKFKMSKIHQNFINLINYQKYSFVSEGKQRLYL